MNWSRPLHWPGVALARRMSARVAADHLSIIAAGVAFYVLLAIFPALAALQVPRRGLLDALGFAALDLGRTEFKQTLWITFAIEDGTHHRQTARAGKAGNGVVQLIDHALQLCGTCVAAISMRSARSPMQSCNRRISAGGTKPARSRTHQSDERSRCSRQHPAA